MALRDVNRESSPGFGPPWLQGRDVPVGACSGSGSFHSVISVAVAVSCEYFPWMWLFPVDISHRCGCFQWIFSMDVAVSSGYFPWMWLFPIHVFSPCFQWLFSASLPARGRGSCFSSVGGRSWNHPTGNIRAVCPSHRADASSCACGRAGNSREWPQNSNHGNDFIAGSKLLEPPTVPRGCGEAGICG